MPWLAASSARSTLSALVSGATGSPLDAAGCPEPDFVASRLCALLKKSCLPGRAERPEAVRAAVRCLAWLAHPDTTCIEDLVRAPGCVGWIGDGLADDPARETRAALARINSRAARDQLQAPPPPSASVLH